MKVASTDSDQPDLRSQQHQPSREGNRVHMHDHRIRRCPGRHVMQYLRPETGDHRHRDQGDVGEKEAAIPGVMSRKGRGMNSTPGLHGDVDRLQFVAPLDDMTSSRTLPVVFSHAPPPRPCRMRSSPRIPGLATGADSSTDAAFARGRANTVQIGIEIESVTRYGVTRYGESRDGGCCTTHEGDARASAGAGPQGVAPGHCGCTIRVGATSDLAPSGRSRQRR